MDDEERRARRVLGVGDDAPADEVRRAFRVLARRHHPDRTHHLSAAERADSARRFTEVQAAWDLLSRGRRAPRPSAPPPGSAADDVHPDPADLDPNDLDGDGLDDLDDRPLPGSAPVGWVAVVPVVLLLTSVALFGLSIVLSAGPLWTAAGLVFLLALASFALAPFFVMLRSHR